VTILHFRRGAICAGIDLRHASALWEFFDELVAGPGRVLLIDFAPGDLSHDSRARMNERAQHIIAEEHTEYSTVYRARMELAREDVAVHRYLECLRDGRLFVVGAYQGEIDIQLLGLLLACDLRLVSEDSFILKRAEPWSLAPGTGVPWFLTRIVGQSRALEILLDDHTLSARRACELGLVHRLTRADSHNREALAMAQAIAEKGAQHLLSLKRLLARSLMPLDMYLKAEGAGSKCLRISSACCRRCGYNLTGNVSGRCPECGRAVDSAVAGQAECISQAEVG